MYRELFMQSRLHALPLLALVIFVSVFVAVVIRTMSRKRKDQFEQLSQLPLFDNSEEARHDD